MTSSLDSVSAEWTIRSTGEERSECQQDVRQQGARRRACDRSSAAWPSLAAMNRRKLPSVVELARDTRLPRPTVYRLLETLSRAGFVTRSSPHDRYCLARKVRTLSDGFVEDAWIADIAAPLMTQFTRETGVAGRADDVRGRPHAGARDDARSQHAIDRSRHGRTVSCRLLRTAAGRCYLAFCPAKERRANRRNVVAVGGAGGSLGQRDRGG